MVVVVVVVVVMMVEVQGGGGSAGGGGGDGGGPLDFCPLGSSPVLIGEANLFPRLVSGLFFASLLGKCLEQMRW